MPFYADLHIHSKYSRATSRDCDLENLSLWAQKKGISVIGTGDFTHPAWAAELKEKLVPAEPGLFRLRDDIAREVERQLPPVCRGEVRFMLSVEISTIYKKGDRTRKVHHVVYAPGLEAAKKFTGSLDKIGNIKSDGRPILGLDSRDLLEITLESGDDSFLVPAHIWTPWFSVLGSKSGFDSIDECYGDLSHHIFALETGLSSDPPMNWRLSGLDRYRLVSNSDAHSPPKLGREANVFETQMDYHAMRAALETGKGFAGTVEFFPEEGKYHLDGHRKCGVRLTPLETREKDMICPECGKPVTVGVMHRVEDLADREEGKRPKGAASFVSLIPLVEVISEIVGVGSASKAVKKVYEGMVSRLGPELAILEHLPLEDVRRSGSPVIAEAISRMRERKVIREAGFDGEFGVIKLFEGDELKGGVSPRTLFEIGPEEELPSAEDSGKGKASRASTQKKATVTNGGKKKQAKKPKKKQAKKSKAKPPRQRAVGKQKPLGILFGLDPDQKAAAEITTGPLLIVAGPGTGKTRTLTHRIAHLVSDRGVPPEHCLAITFTRRAAEEVRDRLDSLLPEVSMQVPVMTFHSLGLCILREHGHILGLPDNFRIASDRERTVVLARALIVTEAKAAKLLKRISTFKRTRTRPDEIEIAQAMDVYKLRLEENALVDYDDLIALAVKLLESGPGMQSLYRERYQWISVDEYQDIDELQYRLVRLMVPPKGNLCAIGDPDQAIYGFRGADVKFFLAFQKDFAGAQVVSLSRNYRSTRIILDASTQVISPSSLAGNRPLKALIDDPIRIVIHEAASDKAEAEFTVHTIERMIGGHSFFSIDSGRVDSDGDDGCSFSDFAVLYRTDAQANLLCEALARSGMPFRKCSHNRLLDFPEVEGIVRVLRETKGAGLVSECLEEAGDKIVRAGAPSPVAVEDAVEMLMPLARDCGDDLDQFLSELVLGAAIDAWDPRADRISLLTLHAAKGLEFRAVFIVGLEDGIMPLRWGPKDESDVAEERRLFYVGMTRAKARLFLSRARKRMWRGKVKKADISPFLLDIEEELLERTKSRSRKKVVKPSSRQLDMF